VHPQPVGQNAVPFEAPNTVLYHDAIARLLGIAKFIVFRQLTAARFFGWQEQFATGIRFIEALKSRINAHHQAVKPRFFRR